ncbi:MAG TPA: helix-turn-helix transcriptional regulator [Micromonosporaceae bacterium]|nr:helix-turn-helix transcriptional regulator [Micromonosporaceae bacterium]
MTPDRSPAGPDQGVYSISVAAELTGVGPQTLRLYEEKGLIVPARTDGGTRRYSGRDIARIRRIAELTAGGLNLAGVRRVLELEAENDRLRARLTEALGED